MKHLVLRALFLHGCDLRERLVKWLDPSVLVSVVVVALIGKDRASDPEASHKQKRILGRAPRLSVALPPGPMNRPHCKSRDVSGSAKEGQVLQAAEAWMR